VRQQSLMCTIYVIRKICYTKIIPKICIENSQIVKVTGVPHSSLDSNLGNVPPHNKLYRHHQFVWFK